MILIQCNKCEDIFPVTQNSKICSCGSTMAAITGDNLISHTGDISAIEIDDVDLKFCKKINKTQEGVKVPCLLLHNDKRLIKLNTKLNQVLV